MSKFAIISAVLVVSVVTVMGDFVVRDYVAREGETSVVSAQESETEDSKNKNAQNGTDFENPPVTSDPLPATNSAPQVFPVDSTFVGVTLPPVSRLTEALVKQSGFVGTMAEKQFDGKVYQLLDITKNPVAAINHYEIPQDGVPIASITEIILPDEIRALQMYVLLQNKTKTYIDLSLNETNAYGDRSFYVNHAKKPDEAFLTVKIGKYIYCIAYVKSFHPQVKQLLALLAV